MSCPKIVKRVMLEHNSDGIMKNKVAIMIAVSEVYRLCCFSFKKQKY